MKMYEIEVYRTEGNDIAIKQSAYRDEEFGIVVLSPAQVNAVCAWMRAVRKEIEHQNG